jgi:hypothetical protein
MPSARKRVTALLSHYFRILFEKAGLSWDEDNQAEIECLVDEIFNEIEQVGTQSLQRDIITLQKIGLLLPQGEMVDER